MSKMIDNQGNTLVNVTESALPSGAATGAKQDTGNTSLGSIDTKLSSQATAAKQDTGNTSLASIDGKITAVNTGAVVVSSSALPSGAATAANQTAEATLVGAVTETAPASDTASSGLNGRLQRIAQRITSPIALLPSALGAGGGLKVEGTSGAATGYVPVRLSDGSSFLAASQDATHDSAANSTGPQIMGVGSATAPTDVSADGDAVRIWALKNGTVAVNLRDSAGAEVSVGGGTQYTEDAAAAANPVGTVPMLVRKDTPASEVSADGDNIAARASAYGAQYVTLLDTGGSPVSVGGGTQYTEDAASAADPIGNALIMVRKDTLAAITSADGDNIAARATNKGELYVKHADAIPVTDNGSTLSIDDGAGSITVDGTVAVSGSVAVTNADITTLAGAVRAEDVASADGHTGIPAMAVRKATPANTSGADGDYEMLQVSAGRLWASATIDAALPAGTNAIGKLAANSGVDIGDVDVTTLGGQSPAFNSGARSSATLRTTIATDDVIALEARATGNGATPFKLNSAASTNATSVKASAGQVYMITASNINAAVRYLKFYNKASAPTVGTDTPVLVFAIPGNTAGAGTNIPVPAAGLAFSTGIAFALTTGAADSDTGAVAANDIIVNLAYK